MLMTETDWDFMLDTAVLHQMLWSGTSPSGRGNGAVSAVQLASEIRQRVSKFGATYEDRKKLRMSVDTPQSRMDAQSDDAEQAAVDYAALVLDD